MKCAKYAESLRDCEKDNQTMIMKLRFRIFCLSILLFWFLMLWRNVKINHTNCHNEGDSETNNLVSNNIRHGVSASSKEAQAKSEEELTERVRVLCWIMTSPDNHKTRVRAKHDFSFLFKDGFWMKLLHLQAVHVKPEISFFKSKDGFWVKLLVAGGACEGDLGKTLQQAALLQL